NRKCGPDECIASASGDQVAITLHDDRLDSLVLVANHLVESPDIATGSVVDNQIAIALKLHVVSATVRGIALAANHGGAALKRKPACERGAAGIVGIPAWRRPAFEHMVFVAIGRGTALDPGSVGAEH